MALAIARPWKYPQAGIYRLRKRVPEELRALRGKTVYCATGWILPSAAFSVRAANMARAFCRMRERWKVHGRPGLQVGMPGSGRSGRQAIARERTFVVRSPAEQTIVLA